MPNKVEAKTVDPEAKLSKALRTCQKLAPQCSVAKRAAGIPQLAPQEKQIGILTNEMDDTLLCINLAKKGLHAIRDANTKSRIRKSIVQYEKLETELRDERWQQAEVDCLNHLAQKNIIDLFGVIPTEADELGMLENANNRLRRMENRLDLATKRFCVVNADNKHVREEINRLLVERESFNTQWRHTINNLIKGKEYLMDIFEMATQTFADRDECCRKLDTLKWKGLFQLNKDITEMQFYDGELNYLSKLEEFLRVKSTTRICESDEMETEKRELEMVKCEQQIAKYDALLQKIFDFSESKRIASTITRFQSGEINNFSAFILLCEVLQSSIFLTRELEPMRQKILDYSDRNEAREEKQNKELAELTEQLENQQKRSLELLERNAAVEEMLNKVLLGIKELTSMAMCDTTPLLSLLGNHNEVTKWNVHKFVSILECEVKTLIEVAYGIVKPPPPTPVTKKSGKHVITPRTTTKLIADPHVEPLRPKDIDDMVPYQPCAYCVEDYIMHLVYETPAVLADEQYIQNIFHLEDVNTNFGIYTLTIPGKRHTLRRNKN